MPNYLRDLIRDFVDDGLPGWVHGVFLPRGPRGRVGEVLVVTTSEGLYRVTPDSVLGALRAITEGRIKLDPDIVATLKETLGDGEIHPNYDSECASVLFQVAVFGDVVYS
jgi:hypothetical protein